MFYLMFHYSIVVAIIVHFLFDLFSFFVLYIDACIERKNGRVPGNSQSRV